MDEFETIASLFRPLTRGFGGALELMDDAAFVEGDGASDLVVTMDSMVADIHFFASDPPDLIARKLVRVNISDLAAKGARPHALLLSIALPPQCRSEWLKSFVAGLAADLEEFDVPLIGGDTVSTPGPLTLSLTAMGKVAKGRMLRRSGGGAGDLIAVTGTIGDGGLGLLAHQGKVDDPTGWLKQRYWLPQPRLTFGLGLTGLAHAAMDVSDGLLQDLGHILKASNLGAEIDATQVPLSPAAAKLVQNDQKHLNHCLSAGDDYELLFSFPACDLERVRELSTATSTPFQVIGTLKAEVGLNVTGLNQADLHDSGWRHF